MIRMLPTALLAALPLLASAQSKTLVVEYEGTVKSAEPSPDWDYRPGDPVKGVVRIYPLLAPPDRNPASWGGSYSPGGGPGENFIVSGFVNSNRHGDYVQVLPLGDPGRGVWAFSDRGSVEPNSSTTYRDFTIEVSGLDLTDDGLVQTFDVQPKKDGSSIISALIQGVGEVRRTVTFALTRVSVTPGRCRA